MLRGPVILTHLLLARYVRDGDRVVDATCGNGNDTLLLAELCGRNGHVWGFDIQQHALDETARRVTEAGMEERVTLLLAGHEDMLSHTSGPLKAVCFNLGYLPGGDRSLITRPETTLSALEHSLQLISAGGIVAVTLYSGHAGGADEKTAVEGWATALPPQKYHCWRMGQLNVPADAPFVIVIQKVV
ncbi:MAG: class I SAM-dependent methyltransferase [Desulfuromonadales bacterium]